MKVRNVSTHPTILVIAINLEKAHHVGAIATNENLGSHGGSGYRKIPENNKEPRGLDYTGNAKQ